MRHGRLVLQRGPFTQAWCQPLPQCTPSMITFNPEPMSGFIDLFIIGDGEEAVDYLQQRGRYAHPDSAPRPDLILLDLNLPGKSGLEVLQVIKQAAELKSIPVVVLTTSDRDEDVNRCYLHGTNSYLTKPVQFDDCLKLVGDIQQYWLHISKLPPR